MKSPLLALAGAFALGILATSQSHSPLPQTISSVTLLLVFSSACLLLGVVLLRANWQKASGVLALAGIVIAGAATARLFEHRFPPDDISQLGFWGIRVDGPLRLEGNVASNPLWTAYALEFDLKVTKIESGTPMTRAGARNWTGRVRLRLETGDDETGMAAADALHLRFGDKIHALVRLQKPRVYHNPGAFDFRWWMESIQDLYWQGRIKSPLLVEKLPGSPPLTFSREIENIRIHLIRSIDGLFPPWSRNARDGAVLKAVFLGDRSSLDSDTIDGFRKTGLYHLLVISGLHVGLLALLLALLLRVTPLHETWRSALILVFLLGYSFLVEQRAPTLRATLMISFYLLARILYRRHAALNAVGLAALVLLLYRPAWLFDSGFLLSFSAALLIVGLTVPILARTTEPYRIALRGITNVNRDSSLAPRQAQFRLDLRTLISWLKSRSQFLERRPAFASALITTPFRIILWTANMLLFSAVLQLGLLLPMAETFHRVALAGIGLNALAIPVMTLLLGLGIPTILLGSLSLELAAWPAKVLAFIINSLFTLTALPHLPRWLSFRVPGPPWWVAIGFAISAIIAAWSLDKSRRTFWASIAASGVFVVLIALHPFGANLPTGSLEVTALDCGDGDALFMVLPDRTTFLVDAGGSRTWRTSVGAFQRPRWDPGEDIVSPYLWSRGIQKIDIVALSHAHEDHMGGLAAVFRNFRVGEFWHGVNPPTTPYEALLDEVKRHGVPIRQLTAGEQVTRGRTTIQILWPRSDDTDVAGSSAPTNDDSLVMRISDGSSSVLLPGDISSKVEWELVRSGIPPAAALKVAHQGSKTSSASEFLRRVSPRVALVSGQAGGLDNLPSREALARLQASGARVYRTDLDGAVTVEMRGSWLAVQTYRKLTAE